MQHYDSCVDNFWHENKNSANWCAQESKGIPLKTAHLTLLTSYFLLKLTYFLEKVLSDNLENKFCKIMIHSKLQEPYDGPNGSLFISILLQNSEF